MEVTLHILNDTLHIFLRKFQICLHWIREAIYLLRDLRLSVLYLKLSGKYRMLQKEGMQCRWKMKLKKINYFSTCLNHAS